MSKRITIKVLGMSCQGCAANIANALKSVAGVEDVNVDLKGAKATVEFDPAKAEQKDLEKAVIGAGYKVG